MADSGQTPTARDQALTLIDYLLAFEALRRPPVRRVADHRLFRFSAANLPQHPAVRVHPDDERWLSVDFVDLPTAPSIPGRVADLLVDAQPLSPVAPPQIVAPPQESVSESATEGAGRRADRWKQETAFAIDWIERVWRPWSAAHHVAGQVKALHRQLFEQREILAVDRETYELVWGFGCLRWNDEVTADTVDHPLLTVPVEIDIDVRTQRVDVRPSGAVEVEARMLNGLNVHDRAGYAAVRQEIVDTDLDPWVIDPNTPGSVTDVYRRLVRAVDDRGTVGDPGERPGTAGDAVVELSWTLFQRRRLPDSEGFLLEMRELYRDLPEVIPPPLRGILTTGDAVPEPACEPAGQRNPGSPGDDLLLLPLPANEQQERILRASRRQAGVVVQGPPGTGKSHTIANLISHFVAEGKRVLVTAEKEQALKVLAEKVPEDIRDLTVSVLGADEEGRRRLGASIRSIQTKVGLVDRRLADERISELTSGIDRLDRRYAEVAGQLRAGRRAEFDKLTGTWAAGKDPTPQVAAGWLAEHPELGYVSDPVQPGTACPLTASEFGELIGLLRSIDPTDAREAVRDLPPLADLPSAGDLTDMFAELRTLAAAAERARATLLGRHGSRSAVPQFADDAEHGRVAEQARTLSVALRDEARWRTSVEGSWVARVAGQCADPRLAAEWTHVAIALAELREQAFDRRAQLSEHDVTVPAEPGAQFEVHLTDARERLRVNGKLGLFARDAKAAVELCRVDGRPPGTAAEVELCLVRLHLEQIRHRLATRWHNQAAAVGAPALAGRPEESVGPVLQTLTDVHRSADRWADLQGRAETLGLGRLSGHPQSLDSAAAEAEDIAAAAREAEITGQLTQLSEKLARAAARPHAAVVWAMLSESLADRDPVAWERAIRRTRDLHAITPQVTRRAELTRLLAAVAPAWTAAITEDPEQAGTPDRLDLAWQWRQLETWVRTVASGPKPAVLQAHLEEIAQERRRTVTELVTERAWRRLVDNLGTPERRALEEYVQASKRFGKTGGKHAGRWIAEMRRAMADATTAVPVWIMPTARALLNFRPAQVPPFDVLIIDEASQIGMTALPLLALAQTTIIVGDDEQTSPENVGLVREPVYRLMDSHLRQIPGYRTAFDPDKSLYDLALMRFPGRIMLTEHFRCLPQIIEFSNQLSYGGRIVPLRDRPPHPAWRPLRTVRVPDGYRSGFVNRPEAEAVAALLADLDTRPEYQDMTFGVISLLGNAQSKLIHDLLYDSLGPAAIERRAIRVAESAGFQGDERDVMVISTVVAVDPSKERTRYSAMTKDADKRRLNVAASRARNQLWVVTSVEPGELPAGDYRAALLAHCAETAVGDEERGNLLDRCESEFERRVVRALLGRGYVDVTVQHRVGQYRLDIVVTGPDARLAIECDGDRWHSETEWDRDRARQQVLERAGWTFERIRGSSFYRDPDTAMEPVWERLTALGIPVGDWRVVPPSQAGVGAVSALAVVDPSMDIPAPVVEPSSAVVDPSTVGLDELPAHWLDDDSELPEIDNAPTTGDSALWDDDLLDDVEPPEQGDQRDGPQTPETHAPSGSLTVEPQVGPAGTEPPVSGPSWTPPAWYRPVEPDDEPAAATDREEKPGPPPVVLSTPGHVPESARSRLDGKPAGSIEGPAEGPPAWYLAMLAEQSAETGAPTQPRDNPRAAADGSSAPGSSFRVAKAPYRQWTPHPLPEPRLGNIDRVVDGLADIVRAEGPLHSERAYHLYVRASGGRRVGSEIRKVLDSATGRAVRRRLIARVGDRFTTAGTSTLFAPGTPPVVLRERGPRDLFEIPRGEVRELMTALGHNLTTGELKRAVLTEWGLTRLTPNVDKYLDECLVYQS